MSVMILVLLYVFMLDFFIFLDIEGWGISPRGAGYLFGSDVVQQVLLKFTVSNHLCRK